MTTVRTSGATLTVVSCYSCGVEYAIPDTINQAALDRRGPNGRSIYCPNGHNWHYIGETEAQKLARILAWERDHRASVSAERDQLAASLRTTKGHVTRLRKRAHAGTCPFGCGRHFADLERHVASKHPGSALEGEA